MAENSTPATLAAHRIPSESRIVGEVKDFQARDWMPDRVERSTARFSQFAIAAARTAEEDSGIAFDRLPKESVSVAIEIAQLWIPNRMADVDDVLLNVAGAMLGYALLSLGRLVSAPRRAVA